MLIVPWTPLQVVVVADQLPGRATVIRPVQSAVLGLDRRPHPPRFSGRDGHSHAAFEALVQARVGGALLPGVAAVGRPVQTAVGATAGEIPEVAPHLPEGGI